MSGIVITTIIIVILALSFDFINGFHDTANAIATSVSTRALRPTHAVILASTMNLVGAVTFTGVAKTISKDIVDPFAIHNGLIVIIAALIGAIIWNLITWYYGIPSSSSHALIGSVAGAAVSAEGFNILNYKGFFGILEALIISPFLALIAGFIVMFIFHSVFKNFNLARTTKGFRTFQVFTAALQSFAHGTNDAQKTMGVITLALIAGGLQHTMDIPYWVRVAAAVSMGLGTSIGGWKIIKTVGGKIMKIKPVNGAAADLASAMVIFGATAMHVPVSTTHVISSAIMGVGSAQRVKGVKWGVAKKIVITWIITLPIAATIAGIVYQVLNLFV